MERQGAFEKLVALVSSIEGVEAIGQSGSGKLPAADESDVDVFIFCSRIPEPEVRREALMPLAGALGSVEIGALHSRHWGEGDCLDLSGMEVWLMYFDARAQREYLEAVLRGEHPDKVDNYFYPTGRLATIAGIKPLYDRSGWLQAAKDLLKAYPGALARKLADRHASMLRDTEDLERAVSRGDVLFYHFALDLALDHFLTALFALNRTYFPSRKRSLEIARGFKIQPEGMPERLHAVLEQGGKPETLRESFEEWERLAGELKALVERDAEPAE